MRCVNDGSVPQQEDGYNCGIHACWNARCFIISQSENPNVTCEDLYKTKTELKLNQNAELKVVVNEDKIRSILDLKKHFSYNIKVIISLRDKFQKLLNALIRLVKSAPSIGDCSSSQIRHVGGGGGNEKTSVKNGIHQTMNRTHYHPDRSVGSSISLSSDDDDYCNMTGTQTVSCDGNNKNGDAQPTLTDSNSRSNINGASSNGSCRSQSGGDKIETCDKHSSSDGSSSLSSNRTGSSTNQNRGANNENVNKNTTIDSDKSDLENDASKPDIPGKISFVVLTCIYFEI